MSAPLVSIGMPAFNSKPAYFSQALSSLLSQTFGDWELVIGDNASTSEESVELYHAAVRQDPRIRLVRHPTNHGSTFNFEYVLQASRGELFCWSADDDIRDPHFLSDCVQLLQREGRSVLAHGGVQEIDPGGQPVRTLSPDGRMASGDVRRRVRALSRMGYQYDVYGLFRRGFLMGSPTVREALRLDYWGIDNVLVLAALLHGPVLHSERTLLHYRVRPSETSLAGKLLDMGLERAEPVAAAEEERSRRMAQAVVHSALPLGEKLAVLSRMALMLQRSPYTNERKHMARYHFRRAMKAGDYQRALQEAVRYWRLSPLAPLRSGTWRQVVGGEG